MEKRLPKYKKARGGLSGSGKLALMALTAVMALTALIMTASGVFCNALYAESTADGDSPVKVFKGDKKSPLVITSNTLNADNKKKTATFAGSVKAVKGDMTFFADTMVVFYREGPRQKEEALIDHIEATGNVSLINGDNVITSEKAVYYGNDEKVVFTGKPEAMDSKNHITGTKMVYYMKEDRSVVENSHVEMRQSGALKEQ
jgi:lipopolysaccharide export system protein LptA